MNVTGQSYAYFDRDLSEYVEKDFVDVETSERDKLKEYGIENIDENKLMGVVNKEVEKRVKRAMKGLIYNLNTMHSRAGAQIPFSSINLGTDTSRGGRLITRYILKEYVRGLGKGEQPIFPNIIFKLKKGVNMFEGDPNYDLFKLSISVTSRRLFPSYSFCDSTFNSIYGDEDVSYMGCRTRVMGNVCGPEVSDGRGNDSFTSINLPQIAIESNCDIDVFMKKLTEIMELVRDQLLFRFEEQCKLKVKDFPFLMGEKLYLGSENLGPNDSIREAIKHGSLSIGFVGLAECLISLTGKHHGESNVSLELGEYIVKYMRELCDKYTKDYNLNFGLLATPAESTAGKFWAADLKRYGEIEGVTTKEKAWYTNSFHVPVEYKISASRKIEIEGIFHKYCNAGHISYVELTSSPKNNPEAIEQLILYMAKCDMGYGSINFPTDYCLDCHLSDVVIDTVCPVCGSDNVERIRRITGYLSSEKNFNWNKREELNHRVKHD